MELARLPEQKYNNLKFVGKVPIIISPSGESMDPLKLHTFTITCDPYVELNESTIFTIYHDGNTYQ